jgi:hypothetical protein
MKEKIIEMYSQALYDDLPPNVFADQVLRLFSVSNSIAIEYAEFCVRCDRKNLPLLCLEDYIKQYCC